MLNGPNVPSLNYFNVVQSSSQKFFFFSEGCVFLMSAVVLVPIHQLSVCGLKLLVDEAISY
jgi:hypothetical protein